MFAIRAALYSCLAQRYSRSEKGLPIGRTIFGLKMSAAFIEKSAVLAVANLLRSMGATQVFIFGSATKGKLRTDSDIDMAVAGLPAPGLLFRDQQSIRHPWQTSRPRGPG